LTKSFPKYEDLVKVRQTIAKINRQQNIDQFKTLRMLATQRKNSKMVGGGRRRRLTVI
jgi:hypothetical protein